MHFVFLNQFYPPEVAPTGVVLEAVAAALKARGHEVTVLCAAGESGLTGVVVEKRVRVVRLRAPSWGLRKSAAGKILAYACYYAGVVWHLFRMKPRPDMIVALTTPPYLSLTARAAAAWHGTRHAHWVMDLYPDVMTAHRMLREGSGLDRLLGFLTRWGMGGPRCHGVMTLGPDMAERLNGYLSPGREAHWVPLWGTAVANPSGETPESLRLRRGWRAGETVFMYSGNMGLGHVFSDLLEAACRMIEEEPEQRVRFAFFGGGKRRGEVQQRLFSAPSRAGMELHDYVPRKDLAAHLQSGDVHLASLDPAWDGMMVPSKLQGIFAAGRPVIFTGSPTCSLGRWILESGGGWVVAPGDIHGHLMALREALDIGERQRRGRAALAFARQWFDHDTNAGQVVDWLTNGFHRP